jgi:hypothetical protein
MAWKRLMCGRALSRSSEKSGSSPTPRVPSEIRTAAAAVFSSSRNETAWCLGFEWVEKFAFIASSFFDDDEPGI